MNWFWYAMLSALCMTLYSLFVRKLLKGRGDSQAFTFLLDFFAGVVIFFFALFETKYSFLNLRYLVVIIALSMIFAIIDLLFIRGRQLEEVSKVSIVVRVGSVWSLFGAAIFLKEPLLPAKIAGVFLIVAGNLIVLWEKQKFKLTRGLQMIMLASILFASASFVDKYMVGNILSPALYKSLIFFLTSFWIFLLVPRRVERIKKELKLQGYSVVLASALVGLSLYFLIKGFQIGEVSRVLPVHSLSLIFSVLAGIFFLGEKEKMAQKIIGAIFAFAGGYLLKAV